MDFFKRHISLLTILVLVIFLFGSYYAVFAPPRDFPSGDIVVIARGASAPDIANELGNAHLIAHPTAFRLVLRIVGASTQVQAGSYRFNTPQNLIIVAYRLIMGDYGLPPTHIVFPEGTTVRDMAAIVTESLPNISTENFFTAGKPYEGYLFPDTYLFSPSIDADGIVKTMRANFDAKIASLSANIAASGRSLSDVVIMASLIEKEARTSAVRHIVSGILWNRFRLGMPLQVDAVFGYIFDRDTYSPSLADLKVDSPYNTYTHTGLPPTPIDNPGLDALDAAINPAKTDYLYYLTDKNGVMHYATTYAGHLANQRKYLP